MSYQFPEIPALVAQTAKEIESQLPGSSATLPGTEKYICEAVVGVSNELYEKAKVTEKDMLPLPGCSPEYIAKHAEVYGVPQLPAAYAEGILYMTGTPDLAVPIYTQFQGPNGVVFETQAAVPLTGGDAFVLVRAIETGPQGNSAGSVKLTLASVVVGLDSSATATNGLYGGEDAEDVEAWRRRMVKTIQQGDLYGKAGDFVIWAKQVPGVTRAWEFLKFQKDTGVLLLFVCDNQDPIIPNGVKIQEVQDHMDLVSPSFADVDVEAPVLVDINPILHIYPDTAAIRADITASLSALSKADDNYSPNEGVFHLSHIESAISGAQAKGLQWWTINSPVADVPLAYNEIPTIKPPAFV